MAMVYTLEKNQLYKDVRERIILSNPDMLHMLTSEKFKTAMVHIGGFISCLEIMAEEPIREQDTKELILTEVVKFIVDEKRQSKVHKRN